jgi:hypothetical protein
MMWTADSKSRQADLGTRKGKVRMILLGAHQRTSQGSGKDESGSGNKDIGYASTQCNVILSILDKRRCPVGSQNNE